MQNEIKDINFFKGGKALFTVHNANGEHYTYKINKGKAEDAPFFVSLLTGPSNESDYQYIGLYNFLNPSLRITYKSKMHPDSKPVKVFNWAVKMILDRQTLPSGYGIVHEGKCCRCGRTLTTPESVEAGIGPECGKR
jgi:hypothetical protein